MFAIPVAKVFIRDNYLQYIKVLSLRHKKSVIVSTVHTWRIKIAIKTRSFLTRLHSSLVLS